jgi:hypothetical protein
VTAPAGDGTSPTGDTIATATITWVTVRILN